MNIAELIKKMNGIRIKKDQIKYELANIENERYSEWKKDNPTSRTAKDKVIAELKNQDKEWQEKELYYIDLSNELSYLTNIYNIVQGMVSNPNYNATDVDIFLSEFDF